MNKLFTFIVSLSVACSACGATVESEVSGNRISVFLPEDAGASAKAVLILPGGGYSHLALQHEGTDWGTWFTDRGITAAVFSYPMPKGAKEVPAAAVREAMKFMRENAEKWGYSPDSIGIMGSSAGGHLASTIATRSSREERPAFQILFYPVITMDSTLTHSGSRRNLLGENPAEADVRLYSNECQVDSLTPRAFIALSDDDRAVPPANSILYYSALKDGGVSVSLHIYPTGGHGWGFRPKFRYHDVMTEELSLWLQSF